MPFVERELTTRVKLCRPDGRLDARSVGWTRRPLCDTTLRGWGRNKRWEYWAVTTPSHVVALTVSSLDYVAIHQVWVLDRSTLETIDTVAVVPFARGAVLARQCGRGTSRGVGRGLAITLEDSDAGTRLRASTARVRVDVEVQRPPDHECLAVVVPWSDRRFQYTVKDVARPASGRITIDGVSHILREGQCWGVLDHGRGRWPYAVTWNWGAASGALEGRVIGVQLGGKWTDGTGSTENALSVDGRLHKISEDLSWTYDRTNWMAPWRVRGERVDVSLEPFFERASDVQLGVIASEMHQCFGRYAGWIADDAGTKVRVDGLVGWMEEARNRW
jgi:hypothetical protein